MPAVPTYVPQIPIQPQFRPQSFWDDLSSAVNTVAQVAGTAGQIANQLGPFLPFQAQPQLPMQAQPQFRPQSFWDDLSNAVNTAARVAGTATQIAGQIAPFLPFQAQPQIPGYAPAAAMPTAPQAQFRPQSFWDDLSSAVNTVAQVAGTAGQIANQLGPFLPFQAQPQLPMQAQPQFRPQSFWDDLSNAVNTAARVAGTATQIAGQIAPFLPFQAQPQIPGYTAGYPAYR